MGRDDRSRLFFSSRSTRIPFPIPFFFFDFPFRRFFSSRKSLRGEKTFPIFTRHKRMALLLPDSFETSDEQNSVTGTG
jgi:hypothetical protein